MRPPHIDYRALLGAHGHAGAAAITPAALRRQTKRPPMSDPSADFAFVRDPDDPRSKPVFFPDLRALAAHIGRARGDRPIQCTDQQMQFRGETAPRHGVKVQTYDDETGAPVDYLGWAWLNGGDAALLNAALPRDTVARSRLRVAS